MEPVRFAVVGIGGFAAVHHRKIRDEEDRGRARLTAVAETALDRFQDEAAAFAQRGARIYGNAAEMLRAEQGRADVVCLPVGIHAHAPLTIAAMEAGYNVLVEKPPAATVEDVDAMIETGRRTGRFCAVGFQLLSSPLLRRLKSLLVSGRLGRLRELACRAHWPRSTSYYERNRWAGTSRLDGEWVLDGPMNNACAHYLMNLLFLAGRTRETAAEPVRVRAEIYAARGIGGEDTTVLLAELSDGARIYFGVTHACREGAGPVFRIAGSRGTITGELHGEMKAVLNGQGEIELENPGGDDHQRLFANVIDYCRGEAPALHSPLALARSMTLTMNAAYESSRRVHAIPKDAIRAVPVRPEARGDLLLDVSGLDRALTAGWEKMATFSDLGVPWAKQTEWFDLAGYSRFTGAGLSD